MMLLSVIMMAAVPALLGTLKSTHVTRMSTQAKNLTQERLDQMRNLAFHVDRQNGPFLDVLDIYFTNAGSSTTTVDTGGGQIVGQFVASGPVNPGEPAGPYYRSTTGPLPGATDFSQVIATQFLAPDGSVIPAARYSDYDSQVTAYDDPPSLMLGVTVITHWLQNGEPKSYTARTRITDTRPQAPQIQSQARAVAVQVSSTDHEGRTLQVQAGVANLDGAQSSGSSVSGLVTGAVASRTGYPEVPGATTRLVGPAGTPATSGSASQQPGSGCDWYSFGQSATTNVTGDITNGLPVAPQNVAATIPFSTAQGSLQQNGGGPCGQLSFHNLLAGAVPVGGAVGTAIAGTPYVQVPDASGSGPSILGAGYLTSSSPTASPVQTQAGSRAGMANPVVMFPQANNGGGLLRARLEDAQIDCTSEGAAVSGSYTLHLQWWGAVEQPAPPPTEEEPEPKPPPLEFRWHEASWTLSSGATDPVLTTGGEVWQPEVTVLESGIHLSDVLQLSGLGTPEPLNPGAPEGGLRGFPNGILTITTTPTLANEAGAGWSAINVVLGQLACVADDRR